MFKEPKNLINEFFNNCEICDQVPVSEDQSEKIRSSLQKRLANEKTQPGQPVKEEKAMKKSTTIHSLVIAATAAAVGALSLIVSANTAPVSEFTAPESSIADNSVPNETDELSEYDYFYAQMSEKYPNFSDEVKADLANYYAEIGREKLAELNDFYNLLNKQYRDNEELVMAERAEEERIGKELSEKNTINEEFRNFLKKLYILESSPRGIDFFDITEEDVAALNVTDEELKEKTRCSPSYDDMDITELIVGETTYNEFKGMQLEHINWGITLHHLDPWTEGSVTIHPDGNGGYQYYRYRDSAPITDEQLLAAIAEGTEKYGDTFTIYY